MDYKAMGHRIRQLRNAADMRQMDVAEKVGISIAFMGHIERGTRVASLDTTLKIAEALGVSIDYLATGRNPEPIPPARIDKRLGIIGDITRMLYEHADEWLPGEIATNREK